MKRTLQRLSGMIGSGGLVSLLLATPVLAAVTIGDTAPITSTNLISKVFSIVSLAAVVLFIILLLIGGIQYLGSFGNEEATTKARKLILDAVVGLFIVLAAGGIARIVLDNLGVGSTTIPGNQGNVLQ